MSTKTSFKSTYTIGGDLTVNRMGYGTMRITGEGIWGPPKDHDESIRVLKAAVAAGVNFIDTADSYGPDVAEELIAEALHPYPTGLVIATKGGFVRTGPNKWEMNGHPDHLKKALDGSLTKLKLDQIDLYQLHRMDPKVPLNDMLQFLKQAQQEGKIKHIGLSEVSVDDIKKAQEQIKVVSVQNQYSMDNRKWESVLEYCQDNDMAFIPWNPINAGKVQNQEKIDPIAKKHNATAHQVALSWLLHHSPNILLIPGTSKVDHLKENLDSANISLDDEDMAALDKLDS
jgi:pyridoxine 4-dehydrogenase